jgi:hypothetical protein
MGSKIRKKGPCVSVLRKIEVDVSQALRGYV